MSTIGLQDAIRSARLDDAPAIAAIYNHYIRHTIITFEEEPITDDAMAARIETVMGSHPWVVYERAGQVLGYAYATQWKPRASYRYAVESTVYLDKNYLGMGIGKPLYAHLIAELQRRGMHVIIGGIALPNEASVALHEGLGFVKVAHFPEIGNKYGPWIDVGYWQLTL